MFEHLYRHFDASGQLLYVGVSISVVQRLAQHRDHAHWFDQIVRVEMTQFNTRKEALAAEREAIISENPLFNIQYSRLRVMAKAAAKTARQVRTKRVAAVPKLQKLDRENAFWQWRMQRRQGAK